MFTLTIMLPSPPPSLRRRIDQKAVFLYLLRTPILKGTMHKGLRLTGWVVISQGGGLPSTDLVLQKLVNTGGGYVQEVVTNFLQ